MSHKKLLEHFKDQTIFPIHVDAVRKWITDRGFQDVINFFPVTLDTSILRGVFYQFRMANSHGPYTEPLNVTNIAYAAYDSDASQRMTCCKEMMHIFDPADSRTASRQELSDLSTALTAPVPGQAGRTPAEIAETEAFIKALAVLVPLSAINALRNSYARRTMTANDVALYFRVPAYLGEYILSEDFMQRHIAYMA